MEDETSRADRDMHSFMLHIHKKKFNKLEEKLYEKCEKLVLNRIIYIDDYIAEITHDPILFQQYDKMNKVILLTKNDITELSKGIKKSLWEKIWGYGNYTILKALTHRFHAHNVLIGHPLCLSMRV